MTATYNATDGTLTELPGMDKPLKGHFIWTDEQGELRYNTTEFDYHLAKYDEHLATLRTIVCSPECRGLWVVGQKLEEGRDYEVRVKREYMIDKSRWLTPVEDMGNPFEDGEFMAFPLPVKSEDDLWEEVCKTVIENSDAEDYDCGPAIMKLQQKYIITKR